VNIEKHADVIFACRFCFMCRHLAPVGNVTFREADTPRGKALIADRVSQDKGAFRDPDFIETFYRDTLSAACRKHCISSYDEASLVRSMREDIVEAGLEPDRVRKLATTIIESGNPFGAQEKDIEISGAKDKASLLYYIDSYTLHKEYGIARAFMAILKKAGGDFAVLPERKSSGKALLALGYRKHAAEAAVKTAEAIKSTGCKTLVSSCPASFNAFKDDYPELGASLEGIEILHSSQFIAGLFANKALKASGDKPRVSYVDSDYLKNYSGITDAPRQALVASGLEIVEFGSNQEESYTLGEGSVVYDMINPDLLAKLRAAVEEKSDGKTPIVTASPYTRHASRNMMRCVEEIVAERVK